MGKYREGIVWGAIALLFVVTAAAPLIGLLVVAWCSTPWALASYLIASIRLLRGREERLRFSLTQLLGFVSWFAAHCGAWRVSFIQMLEEYSRLPTTPPQGCFVCTAVANGHPRVVHGENYLAPNGTAHRVNNQLRVLKALELLLASISPKSHVACRWIYDRLGPRLAAMLVHPALADIGYFVLKPVEWIALVCLRLAIPGRTGLIYSLYSSVPIALHSQPAGIKSLTASRSDADSFIGNRANLPNVRPGIAGAPGTCQVPKMPSPELVPT